jgi:hypothetical protein
VTLEHPMTGGSINFGVDPLTGQLAPMLTRNVDVLHWGLALEFSTLYLTRRFTPGKLPKEEPLNQFVPLVEFSFDSPRGQKTAATMNPGLSYVAVSWQVAAEAIVPLNREAGRTIGVRAQLLLFLQETSSRRCSESRFWAIDYGSAASLRPLWRRPGHSWKRRQGPAPHGAARAGA